MNGMYGTPLKSGRWQGQLTTFLGTTIPVALSIQVGVGSITGEYGATFEEEEYLGTFTATTPDGQNYQFLADRAAASYNAQLSAIGPYQQLTGFVTAGKASGALTLTPAPPLRELPLAAWDA